jgi:hypothetical protein
MQLPWCHLGVHCIAEAILGMLHHAPPVGAGFDMMFRAARNLPPWLGLDHPLGVRGDDAV